MKKFILVAVFATLFTVPAFCQDVEDSVTVVWDESYVPELRANEREEMRKLLAKSAVRDIVYNDGTGCIIYTSTNGKYNYINIRTSSKLLFKDMDDIVNIDITGCGLEDGIAVSKDGELAVFTMKGDPLIPMIDADTLISAVRNPFKSNSYNLWGYAIVKKENELYALDTKGNPYKLEMEKCAFGLNMIMGNIGDDIYVYTPDGSNSQEFVFNTSEKNTEFVEVEILETQGHGRYEYDRKKYSNISPGLVVKRGHNYLLYPGAKKLHVHIKDNDVIGTAGTQKVIFTPRYNHASEAKFLINTWAD